MRIYLKGDALKAFRKPPVKVREDKWTASEDQTILNMAKSSATDPWQEMSSKLCRSPATCLDRYEEHIEKNRPNRVSCKRKITASKPTEESVDKIKRSKVPRDVEVTKAELEEADKLVMWQQLQDAIQTSREHLAYLEKLQSKVERFLTGGQQQRQDEQ